MPEPGDVWTSNKFKSFFGGDGSSTDKLVVGVTDEKVYYFYGSVFLRPIDEVSDEDFDFDGGVTTFDAFLQTQELLHRPK